jgi:delta14-sterol reductase
MWSLLVATFLIVTFIAALFAGSRFLPGTVIEGREEPDGTRWLYRINGMALFLATHVVVAFGTLVFDLSLAPLVEHFWSLFFVANIVSAAAAYWLYMQALAADPVRAAKLRGAPTARKLMGVELNPRFLGVDLKMFAYEPSLIGLGLLVTAFAYAQFEKYGTITPQMGLFQMFWWVYLATHYYYEEFMITTWDVIAENFGFALLWGDLVLVPFFYSIGGWTLLDDLRPISTVEIAAVTAVYGLGLWIFRSSNSQKHRFKKDANAMIWGAPAQAIDGKLLVSGWWGIGRHLNYTGEILVYLAIAMTTGTRSFAPYLLPLWMCALLAHRALRDERRCWAKYGTLWERYSARAKFRMVPFVY